MAASAGASGSAIGDGSLEPILPDLDIWVRALSRQVPDPLVVHAFARRVEQRQVFMIGWIRQGLLARVRDERQFARLSWVLSAYPDLRVLPADHLRAAMIARILRRKDVPIAPWPALLWAVAERLGGRIWSQGRQWRTWVGDGCPLRT
ncbi:MAG: hypothetical protein H0W83_00540 [Planctomycetes bacterium]|nr:hypothetical protein [Planctomycetota bacterium]